MGIVADFNDSTVGVAVATSLHALGAIGLLGALVVWLAWARERQDGSPNVGLLRGGAITMYVSIFANLLGGFMRTYESDHPGLTELGSSAWVQVISVKHLFIFAAMGALLYLYEVKAVRLQRSGGGRARAPVAVAVVLLGILVAAALGAASEPLLADAPVMDFAPPEPGAFTLYHNATGQLTSTPLAPGSSQGSFEVPTGTQTLQASLAWTPTQTRLALTVTGPNGEIVLGPSAGGSLSGEFAAKPAIGTWNYRITTDEVALDAAWSLSVRISSSDEANLTLLAETVSVAPGQFFEINTQAVVGAGYSWSWTANAEVHFDLHTHFDDDVQYVIEMDATGHDGSHTVERAGGYSFLWENNGTLPIQVTYRVAGEFEVDSYFPPR